MGYPRYLRAPPGQHAIYHCYSRCVRRAFLCGHDPDSGRSFEHRKHWLEQRIAWLAARYAVAVHAYAIMSNHFHLVVEIDPQLPARWSDHDVASRWLDLCAPNAKLSRHTRMRALLDDPQRLQTLRQRLGSLSWFMRHLKEPLARLANREDECTGHFWESRFDSKELLDDPTTLASMVYVDLNPVRAAIAPSPQHSPFTSARQRARSPRAPDAPLLPIASSIRSSLPDIALESYLALLEWTASSLHPEHTAPPATQVPDLLEQLALAPRQWLAHVPASRKRYGRAVGTVESLTRRANDSGRKWLRGIGTARAIARLADTG